MFKSGDINENMLDLISISGDLILIILNKMCKDDVLYSLPLFDIIYFLI